MAENKQGIGLKEVMLVTSFIGSIILGFVWVENRYQQVEMSVCLSSSDALSREIDGNELRLEFYINEMLLPSTTDDRRSYLSQTTLALEARQRVVKQNRENLLC